MKNKLFIFMILSLMLLSVSAVCAEDSASLNLNKTNTATPNSVSCQNNEVELVEDTLSKNDIDFNNLNMSNANEITNEPNTGDTIYVDSINGDDNNMGVDWDNSVKTINKALTLVNDNGVIYLANGEHTTPATIDKNVKLIGQNQEKTILTNSNNCFLTITSNNVGIYNITFKNNQRAIKIDGKEGNRYYINNCSFIKNTVKYGGGGAIHLIDGNLTINNSTFINNTANGDGGAIYITYNSHGNINIIGTVFINNTAEDHNGGAIQNLGYGNITVDNSTFINNTSHSGGAIYTSGKNVIIDNSTFINNTGKGGEGGAIGGSAYDLIMSITIDSSVFINNTSSNGGAIKYAENCDINNSVFIDNSAHYGGAIVIGYNGNKTIKDSVFINNTAEYGDGAIEIYDGNSTIIGSVFINNTAARYGAGAIYISGGNSIIINSIFTNNKLKNDTGGAIKIRNGNSTIINSTFINNTANGGGAIGISNVNSTIINSTFINNTANGGGAIHMDGCNLTINNSIFTNNMVKNGGGGAIYMQNGNSTVINSIFITNMVKQGMGGAVYLFNGNFTINDSIFINNTAPLGGAIYRYYKGNIFDVDGNWWSSNNPDWHSLIYGHDKISYPNSFVVLDVNVNKIGSNIYNVIANLYLNGTQTISDIPTRNITFRCGSEIITGKMVNGTYNKTYMVDVGDKKEVTVSVDNEIQNITIKNQITTSMTINVSDIIYGEDGTITVILPGDINGKLTIYVDNVSSEVDIINGTAQLIVPGLNAGKHDISAVFAGNQKYTSVNSTATLNVAKATPTLNITINDIKYGEILNITATLTGVYNTKLNGNITLTINNKQYIIEVIDGEGTLTGVELSVGSYNFNATWSGDNNYNSTMDSGSFNVSKMDLSILAENIIMIYHDGTRLIAILTDCHGNPIANEIIYFTVNGVTYNRTTNATGGASIALNLISGDYEAVILYNGSDVYTAVSKNVSVTIKSTIDACDVVKFYQNGTQFFATFIDSEGNVLANTNVTFNINGVFYTRQTDENGTAKLNINLRPGYYILTAFNPNSTEQKGFNIIVKSLIEASDLTKYFQNASNFEAIIYNKDGSLAANQTVTFNINGVFYTRTTNDNGVVSLAINLRPGSYIITTVYEGFVVGNSVTVLPTLLTADLEMVYHDGSSFTAKTVDSQGNPLANQTVTFNVNGVFYHKVTGSDGVASLNINLNPGKYIITSIWNDYQVGNNITIV